MEFEKAEHHICSADYKMKKFFELVQWDFL